MIEFGCLKEKVIVVIGGISEGLVVLVRLGMREGMVRLVGIVKEGGWLGFFIVYGIRWLAVFVVCVVGGI